MASDLNKHKAVKAYWQHGFIPLGETETQIFGRCPFCSNNDSLYVNKDTKAWDCKVCGKEGGFLKFLEAIAELCQEQFKGTVAIKLAKSRGLSLKILKSFKVGFNPITKHYCFPVIGAAGKRFHDLRIYKNGKLISTATCKTGLLNWEKILKNEIIYLCEGEWDCMVMQSVIDKLGIKKAVATSVPGAAVFKAEWISLFAGKEVIALYDNDEPGQKGALKVFNLLKTECKQLHFLHWFDDFPVNFDIRDLHKKLKIDKKFYSFIHDNLHDLPMHAKIKDDQIEGTKEEINNGAGMSAQEVYAEYRKWLYLPDPAVIDIIFGTILANRLEGDPLWVFIVAPPGMTKTTLIQTVADCREIEAISTLTPRTLISGSNMGGVDPSLIPKLDKKVLTIKDFTTILNMNQQAREEIFGIFRDIYDGECVKPFGHGITRRYKSKFGIIACVTPAIETFVEKETALGERFLRFSMSLPKSIKEHMTYIRRATENIKNKNNMSASMREIGAQVLNYKFNLDVEIPESIHSKVLYLSMWTAQLRGTIIRDKFSKEILYSPFQELATRISQQYEKLLIGIGAFRRIDKVGELEFSRVRKLALGSVPSKLEEAVRKLYKWGKKRTFQTSELASMIRLPQSTVQQTINSLYILGVLRKVKRSSVKTEYSFHKDFLTLTENGGVYDRVND